MYAKDTKSKRSSPPYQIDTVRWASFIFEAVNLGLIFEVYYNMSLKRVSQFTTVLLILIGLIYLPANAQVMGFYHNQNKTQSDDVLPQTSNLQTNQEGIDFNEWDKDLEKSIRKAERKCKGKNCNFKSRQALESSFDF